NVAQAEHELRAGALRLEGIQAVAKLTLGAERLVIDQDQVRGQSQGGGTQDLTADGPEALLGRLLLGRGPLHTLRREERGQLDVVAPLRESEVGGDRSEEHTSELQSRF